MGSQTIEDWAYPYLGTPITNKLLQSATDLFHVKLGGLILSSTGSLVSVMSMLVRMATNIVRVRVSYGVWGGVLLESCQISSAKQASPESLIRET